VNQPHDTARAPHFTIRWRNVASGRGAVVEVGTESVDLKFDLFVAGAGPHWHNYRPGHSIVRPIHPHDMVGQMAAIVRELTAEVDADELASAAQRVIDRHR
jgi:hypothetical protein